MYLKALNFCLHSLCTTSNPIETKKPINPKIMASGRCNNCAGCTLARQRAERQAAKRRKILNPKCNCDSDIGPEACPIVAKCKEPLAWSISPSEVKDQSNSSLYSLIPAEIRDLIFTFALKDTTSYPIDREPATPNDPGIRRDRYFHRGGGRKAFFYPSNIAFNLLLTCKAVYLETYEKPLRVNSFVITELSEPLKRHLLLPWQFAQITRLDIKLPQMALENGGLRNTLKEWEAQARHENCYVVPRQALILQDLDGRKAGEYPISFDNVLIPAVTKTPDRRPQSINDVLDRAPVPSIRAQPCSSHSRVCLAGKITHLTLRLTAQDWWTWTDDPASTDPHQNLRLDPTFGAPFRSRGSTDEMKLLASDRTAGQPPSLSAECWGTHVTSFLPDLQVLELVLETFKEKIDQLDMVVECARTWAFDVGKETLIWDGESVEKSYTREMAGLRLPRNAPWHDRSRDLEVMVVRFVRDRK